MHELHYCAAELNKAARKLRILSKLPSWITTAFPSFEFAVKMRFLDSATMLRKLQDSHQLPHINSYQINVLRYPYINPNEPISQKMWAADYDSTQLVQEKVDLRKMCNSIIHSYVYDTLYHSGAKRNNIAYIGVASDYDKEKHVYVVSIEDWIKCLSDCAQF